MTEGVTVVILGDEGSEVLTAVEDALDGATGQATTCVTTALAEAAAADCVVATSVDDAAALLDAADGELPVPLVVLTDASTASLTEHARVRAHPADSLDTLASRVVDAVLADHERQQTNELGLTYDELVEHEAAYRTLVENVPDGGVALFDRDLRYTWVGGEVFERVNLDPDEVAGKPLDEVHSAAFVDAYADDYRAVFDGERSTMEFTYDGRVFHLDVVPVYEDGEVVAGMTMTRDITERVERQRDLFVRTRAMDAAAIGLCLTDPNQPDNPLVYVNEGYERMTGYDAEEVLGKNPRHLQGPETEPEEKRRMREAVENAEAVAVDITNYRKDGTPFVNHVEITPIFDDEGELVHFLGSQVDVSEQYDRERMLARQNEQLAEFASIVSHDLRSPLSVAQGRLRLARKTGDLAHLDRAEESLDRATELIGDLLTLAREGQSLDPDRVQHLSIGDVAREVWNAVATSGATLHVDGDVTVDADESRLRQLFANLFRNSVEHGSTGSRPQAGDSIEHGATDGRSGPDESTAHGSDPSDDDIEIRVGPLTDECGFFVADDGPGVPDSVRDQIFDAGVTTAEDGTGFGLAIVRRVAEAHDWTVRLADTDQGGARFEFIFPCRDE
jgi:PAS domain S-box-containing protein